MDINNDAREFGLHVKQGGWRLGLLVARNVEKGKGQGSRTDLPTTVEKLAKVSCVEFAQIAGCSDKKVARHLDAWNRAAADGLVPPADTLSPGEEVELDARQARLASKGTTSGLGAATTRGCRS